MSGDYQDLSPIVAASTSMNSAAGIGIVRLSGFKSLTSLQKLFSRNLGSIGPGRFYRTKIYDSSSAQIDDGGVVFFKAPHSYNGENILEVHMHGNPVLMRFFIKNVVDLGLARHALAGEFSYRAFLNSKLTLSQVEGLDLVLTSKSMKGIRQGISSLDGELHQSFSDLYSKYLRFKSAIELNIDFLEDIGEEGGSHELQDSYLALKTQILSLAKRTVSDASSILSPKVVLLGKTNAGKSTLFNYLLGTDRSIVSSEEGTTRDYVSENLFIGSDQYSLVDTAGVRIGAGKIEEEGIRRAAEIFSRAFFKILVINPKLDFDIESMLELGELDLIVFSHSDEKNFQNNLQRFSEFYPHVERVSFCGLSGSIEPLSQGNFGSIGSIGPKISNNVGPIGPKSGSIGPEISGSIEPDSITNGSIGPADELNLIASFVASKYQKLLSNDPLLIDRQCELLRTLAGECTGMEDLLGGDIAILSAEVNSLGRKLTELIGIISPDDVLHNIFNNFCIGK